LAIRPALTGLDRADDRMPALAGMPARVAIRRRVAAADVPAAAAGSQVQPCAADRETVLAARHVIRPFDDDLIEMRARDHRCPPRLGLESSTHPWPSGSSPSRRSPPSY